MTVTYEPRDIDTGNIIGAFTTSKDALDAVRMLLQTFESDYASNSTLGRRDHTGSFHTVANGDDLVAAVGHGLAEFAQHGRVALA